jgi:hypothetical protein
MLHAACHLAVHFRRNLAAWGIAALENKGTFVSGMLITVVSRSWFVFFLCRNG